MREAVRSGEAAAVPEFEHAVIGRICVLRPIGDFGGDEAAEALARELTRRAARQWTCVVVNCQRVTRVKAPALVALRTMEARVTSHGGHVRYCGLSDMHREWLSREKGTKDLPDVFETEQEAIDSCGGSERPTAC